MKKIVGVMGGSACTREEYLLAADAGSLIAANGFVLLCGGGSGIMEAAARGARETGGTTLGILPGSSPQESPPNPYIDIPIYTGMSDGRNAVNAKTSDVVIAIGGGYGTLSEIALALKNGKPVIAFRTWNISREDTELTNLYRAETLGEVETLLQRLTGKK